jgi:hypothetical protein
MRDVGLGMVEVDRYAILRENMQDFPGPDFPPEVEDEWDWGLRHLHWGWCERAPEHVAEALRLWEPHGPAMEQVLDGLRWIERNTGVRVQDIRPSNVGESESSGVGMRDLGNADIPENLLERVRRRDFCRLPSTVTGCVPVLATK